MAARPREKEVYSSSHEKMEKGGRGWGLLLSLSFSSQGHVRIYALFLGCCYARLEGGGGGRVNGISPDGSVFRTKEEKKMMIVV